MKSWNQIAKNKQDISKIQCWSLTETIAEKCERKSTRVRINFRTVYLNDIDHCLQRLKVKSFVWKCLKELFLALFMLEESNFLVIARHHFLKTIALNYKQMLNRMGKSCNAHNAQKIMRNFVQSIIISFLSFIVLIKSYAPLLKPKSCTSLRLASLSEAKIEAIRREDFPILERIVHPGKKLIFLDSAASSQKPLVVIKKMDEYYQTTHANVHRGAYSIANKATEMFETARSKVQTFINSRHREEIIFTRGATEAINLVSMSFGSSFLPGDEIIISVMEHHSNLVPWQMLAQRTGAILKFVHLNADMGLDMDQYRSLLSHKTKLVAVAYVSNVLGVVNPVEEIITAAHEVGAKVLLDACQAVPHLPVDVQRLNVDFLAASSHKMCGPTGIGFLYGKLDLLEKMPPVFGGGEMIDRVELQRSTYAPPPARFEAGTPAIAEAVGLSTAIDYLSEIGMNVVHDHEVRLGNYLFERLREIPSLVLYGPDPAKGYKRCGLVSFTSKDVHPTDLALFLDQEGVAVRTGHHCAQPLHDLLQVAGSMRASLYFYNNKEDVDNFITKLDETLSLFRKLR